jgi:dTDP-4-amino-4,6-dideoxygalactose transaminase
MSVPLFDTSAPIAPLRDELRDAISRVVDSETFVLGPEVQAFERELATFVGVGDAVGVGNGTDALTIALRAMGVGPGDDVVVPSFTFYASAEAIPPIGARPVFCDIDPETFCVTAETVRAALTPRTKAVIVVHLFGNVAPVAEIEALGVPVLEDAAQALGSKGPEGRPGSLGTAATFSFYPSKNLGAFGDGGAVTTPDPELADRVRRLRFHGSRDKLTFEEIGYNSRLDAIQAAVLRVQLPHLDRWSDGRRAGVAHYRSAGLAELVSLPRVIGGVEPAWHMYVVRTPEPDSLAAALQAQGIGARRCYRVPTHEQPGMREFAPDRQLPGTELAARTNVAIPISPVLGETQANEVVDAVRGHLAASPLAVGTSPN